MNHPTLSRIPLLTLAALALVAALPQSVRAQAVTVSTLVNFDGTNGDTPYAALTFARDGNFYGTTRGNPDSRTALGTVFKLTPGGALTTLANFTDGNGNARPNGLVQGTDGNFYGTTQGLYSSGFVFAVTSAGAVTTLHAFGGTLGRDANGSAIPDGSTPMAGLIQARDGNFYGTTFTNGGGYGAIFAISSGGAYSQLASFVDNPANPGSGLYGRNPDTALLQGSDGNFYGTTRSGGPGGQGTVFKYTPGSGLSLLVSFSGPNGAGEISDLVQGTDGNFYGTSSNGGSRPNPNAGGTVFRVSPTGQLTTLVNFDGANGNAPQAALVLGRDGNFYGTTSSGGAGNFGTIFKMTPAGALTTLYNFPDNASKGAYPYAALVQGPNGDFYGTTILGGSGGRGVVFRMNISPNSVQEKTLGNISTRLGVQTGDNVLIAGFFISGTVPKKVLIRGIGPSLGRFGIANPLLDPTLDLRDLKAVVASNDDWQMATNAAQIPANLQPTDSREPAILATLQPGTYTAIMSGKDKTTGVGLVEVYDLDQAAASKLDNISTRGFVDVDDNVMIGGFVVGPITKVLVRAIGPSLGQYGIGNPLLNPSLDLRNENGVLVAANDNWKDTQQAEIQASGKAPSDDRESALIQTLPAGSYTAIVRGVGRTTGTALVEVYNQ